MSQALTSSPAPSSDDVDALVIKHSKKIGNLLTTLSVSSECDKEHVIKKYDLKSKGMADHYQDYFTEDVRLRREDVSIQRKTTVFGIGAAALALAGAIFTRERFSPSKLIQSVYITLSGAAAGILGSFLGSRLFGDRNRKDSEKLAQSACKALKRELAVKIENEEKALAGIAPDIPAPLPPVPEPAASRIQSRDPNYAAQAIQDKAAQNASHALMA